MDLFYCVVAPLIISGFFISWVTIKNVHKVRADYLNKIIKLFGANQEMREKIFLMENGYRVIMYKLLCESTNLLEEMRS